MLNQRIADFKGLVVANHSDITSAADRAWQLVNSTGEVPRLRDFLKGQDKGIHHLNKELPKLFANDGFELKFAAILVHKKPIVRPLKDFKKGKLASGIAPNPELGDLNTVFLFLDNAKNVRAARSILSQAKTVRASNTKAISDSHQKYLYDKAEGFQYVNGQYKDANRSLPLVSQRRRGMHYLFVSETPVSYSPVPSGSPAFAPWSLSLYQILLDAEGVILAAGQAKGSGWSKINEDLINIFRNDATLKANNLAALASWFNNFEDPNHWFADAGEDLVGVNTLLIIVRDKKLKPIELASPEGKIIRER